MRISYNWLKEFVDIDEDPQALATRLTNVGLALDALEKDAGDWLFELDIATNRPDCLSHFGVAREVAAIYGSSLRPPKFALREAEIQAGDVFSISIADPDLCGRYCGRYISGVTIKPSPEWLKKRLEAVGVRSINNVADVTNYVMMELGQPLHAFDADRLARHHIIVRRAELDEKLTTLDGIERQLNPSMLMIADAERAVAIAGVMGGADTEISVATKNVLLESANFNALSIRRTARELGLSSEASYRFERGADIEMAAFVCDRAAAMIQELAGGEIYRGVIDRFPGKTQPVTVSLRRARIAAFLGAEVEDAIVERILKRLGFNIAPTGEGWWIEVPSHRVDISLEEDLLEEIARHHGFDKFPTTLPSWSGYGSGLPMEQEERLLRNRLSACGYTEIVPMAFSDETAERRFRPDTQPVRLLNPMSEEQAILRTSLLPSMLRVIQWNVNRGLRDLQLYELGKIYRAGSENSALVLAATGDLLQKSVHEAQRVFGFFDLKGDVERILQAFDIKSGTECSGLPAYYHPGRSARFGQFATFGELHPEYAEAFKLRHRIYIAEIDVESVLQSRHRRRIEAVPRFPSIRRDLSFLVDSDVRYAQIREAIPDFPELVRVEPFDRLERGSFPETKYSLSMSFIYRSPDRTLTDAEVEQIENRILGALRMQGLGIEQRK